MGGSPATAKPVLIVRTLTGGTYYILASDLAHARQTNEVNVPLFDLVAGKRVDELHPQRRPGDPRGRLRLSSIASTEVVPAPIQADADARVERERLDSQNQSERVAVADEPVPAIELDSITAYELPPPERDSESQSY